MTNELEQRLLNTHAGAQWHKIGVHHHHGICLPLFSLYTEKSGGIGEFVDLIPLISWCKAIGFDIIQLLPLNDTGLDSSPYNAISAIALNPIHLALHALPYVEKVPYYEEKLSKLREWNLSPRVLYSEVRAYKRAFLKDYYAAVFPDFMESEEYRTFLSKHDWIPSYALYKALKAAHGWASWETWPTHHKSPSEHTYAELLKEFKEDVQLHSFVQYLCFMQFEDVKAFAEKEGIFLKGDVPILISRDSADVWAYRHYFLLHLAAGAPPDLYAKEGQYWGFPLYDWEALEKDNYAWWCKRLHAASELYDLYRIDHVVGFFRLWAIPLERNATEGSFLPADERQWIPHGRKIMEMMLHAAPILPIGEDLGVVPPIVKQCLADLGICGTKMMRWERRWEEDGGFIPPSSYPPESMTTVSTHDSDTLQLWWKHFPKDAKLFSDFKKWDYKPFLTQERQEEILHDSHHSGSLFHINLFHEYLALYPELVSPNPSDERINIPGKVLDTNWTYRFHTSLEEIMAHAGLKAALKSLL